MRCMAAANSPWQGRLPHLEGAVEGRLGLLAPLFELEDRQAEFAGKQFDALAAQQAQDDFSLARHAPALSRRKRA